MFRLWQAVVALAAAVYLIAAINDGTPYFVALPVALLVMSVLASDPEVPK